MVVCINVRAFSRKITEFNYKQLIIHNTQAIEIVSADSYRTVRHIKQYIMSAGIMVQHFMVIESSFAVLEENVTYV